MSKYAMWRTDRPGLWLAAALLAAVATYTTASDRSVAVVPWLLLDLWLARRIWHGGATALAWFRGLQWSGAILFGTVLVAERWDSSIVTKAGPGTVLVFALSGWCLMAPALTRHVSARARGDHSTAAQVVANAGPSGG
ncbi:MAG: hypothetical protein ACRDO2_05840 [Nocardioidaceae bacterium]